MNLITAALALSLAGANPGNAVFPLLKIGQGPRASAMGESFTGLADDASTVYWNPAGLGQVVGHHLALSHQEWFESIRDEIGHATLPLGPGAFGLGLVYTSEPDVRYWDESLRKFQTFDAWNAVVTAGYGWRLTNKYMLGATATGLYQDLKHQAGYGAAVDVGVVGQPIENLRFGAAGRHLGIMTFGSGYEKLPMELAAGVSYGIPILEEGVLRLTVDAVVPALDNVPNFRGGVEFAPIKALALRLGYRSGPVDLSGLGYLTGLCSGIGITAGNFGLDYAFVPYGELGMTHRVGLRSVIPPPTHGAWTLTVLDAETGERLTATVAVSGVADTTALADEVNLARLLPGIGRVHVSLDEYTPATISFDVAAGRHRRDTVRLRMMRSELTGGFYDAKTGDRIGGKLVYSGPLSGTLPVPAEPSTYSITNAPKGTYTMEAFGPTDEYLPQTCTLNVPAGQKVKRDFNLWKKGDLLYLMVNFETGKADILPQFTADIDRVGLIIKQTPQIRKIELSGHTDPRDIKTKEFPSNWELSQARADAVKKYLVEKFGIDPNRIVTKGYADTRPIAPNTTPEGMYKNRRTELRILE